MKRIKFLSGNMLKVIAAITMTIDHIGLIFFPSNNLLRMIGRISFPIFAFMIVEGYFHTGNLKRYALRLFLSALISEIPFNLMYSSSVIFPFHQNVIWTLLLGLGLIHINELAARKGKIWLRILTGCITVIAGFLLGTLTMVDYFGVGVVTILVFYFFRKRKWWCLLGQIVILYYLNVEVLSGLYFEITILGKTIHIVQQGLALLALVPIWLYQGRKGNKSKVFQYICYGFYPVHMLLLYLLRY